MDAKKVESTELIRLRTDLHRRVKVRAAQLGTTMRQVLDQAVESWLSLLESRRS